MWEQSVKSFDERRNLIIPGSETQTVQFCVDQFIEVAQQAIGSHGFFTVALSGGSTPNAIFKALSHPKNVAKVDWDHVFCFWSDERSVPPNHSENNYQAAMQAGIGSLPIPKNHIFRMHAESDIEENAKNYEKHIQDHVPEGRFDLIMLGMGDDGHTASLFPRTHGLHTKDRWVTANYVPQKKTWRMSLTFACIEQAHLTCIYVMGKNKADTVARVLNGPYDPDNLPAQRVGTTHRKVLWILDEAAAFKLLQDIL
jgi:6-phosphogluconolactonase